MKKKTAPKKPKMDFRALGEASAGKAFAHSPAAPRGFADVVAGVVNATKNAPVAQPKAKRRRQGSIVCRVLPAVQEELRNASETLGTSQTRILEEAILQHVARIKAERAARGEVWMIAPDVRKTRNR